MKRVLGSCRSRVGADDDGGGAPGGAAMQQAQIVSSVPATNTPNVLNGTVYGRAGRAKDSGGRLVHAGRKPWRHDLQPVEPVCVQHPSRPGGHQLRAQPRRHRLHARDRSRRHRGLRRRDVLQHRRSAAEATGQAQPRDRHADRGLQRPSRRPRSSRSSSSGTRLFIGGSETKIAPAVRGRFGAVNTTTGAVDPNVTVSFTAKRAGTLRVAHMAVSPDGTKLVVVGTFTLANGGDRQPDRHAQPDHHSGQRGQLGDRRLQGGLLDQVRHRPARRRLLAGRVVLRGGESRSPTGSFCDSAQRWETNATGTGLAPTWIDYTGGDSLTAVTVTGGAVYVGGHQRWMNNPYGSDAAAGGAVQRFGIAALDPVNGLPYAWNPGRDPRGTGAWALLPTSQGLYIGSNTGYIDGLYRNRIAFMPLAGGETPPSFTAQGLPGTLYAIGASTLTGQSFNGTSLGSASVVSTPGVDWSQARGGFLLGGELYTAWSDGNMYERSFNGTTLGAATALQLNSLSPTHFAAANVTGMFYSAGRIYYTESGSHYLYWRWFEPEDGLVGAQEFIASGNGDGLDWISTTGATAGRGADLLRDLERGAAVDRLHTTACRSPEPRRRSQPAASPASTGCSSARGLRPGAEPGSRLSPPVRACGRTTSK